MTAKLCKVEGCLVHATHRGMCQRHYTPWKRRNPHLNTYRDTERAVLAALPGTVGEISGAAGVSWEGVRRALDDLYAAGQLHVGDWKRPIKPGERWLPIYVAGQGEDAKVSKAQRHEHGLQLRRARARRNEAVARIKVIPRSQGWAATLLAGIHHSGE